MPSLPTAVDPSDSSIRCGRFALALFQLFRFAIATAQLLAAPIDAGQFTLQLIVRFPQVLDLFVYDRDALVAGHRRVYIRKRMR